MQRKWMTHRLAGLSALALGLGGLLWTDAAAAYILPAHAIVKQLHEARAAMRIRTLKLEGDRLIPGQDPLPFKELYKGPLAHRVELKTPEGQQLLLDLRGKRYTKLPGQSATVTEGDAMSRMLSLLLTTNRDGKNTLSWIKSLNISTDLVSLNRLDGRPVYVIGAASRDLAPPQLWIDHDLLVPVRLLLGTPGKDRLDVRLTGWDLEPDELEKAKDPKKTAEKAIGRVYPKMIERYDNDQLSLRLTYRTLKLNPRLSARVSKRLFTAPR